MSSALAGVFREWTLTYDVPTGSMTTDDFGNPIPEVTTENLTIAFEPYKTPQLLFMEGADPKIVRGRGSCINPATLPSALGPGSELAMTYDGVAGTLRLLQVSLSALEVLDTVLGQEFIAEWRAA